MDDFIVKKKRGSAPITMAFSLILLGASIFCLFMPNINEYESGIAMFIYASGGIGTFYFGYLAIIKLLATISPGVGLVFTQEGLYDFTLPGGGAGFVNWNVVGATKIYGDKKGKFIGIEVQKPKKTFKRVGKRAYAEIMTNIESGMPALVIDCRYIDSVPAAIAEEINERKQEFSQMNFATQVTNRAFQDHAKRQGKATLEDDNREIVTQPSADVVTPPQEQILDAVDEFKNTDDEIEKILKSINATTKEAPVIKIEAEDDESDEKDKKEKKQNVEYRDFGLLFANDDDEK